MKKFVMIINIVLLTFAGILFYQLSTAEVYGERFTAYHEELAEFIGKRASWEVNWPRKLNPVHVVVVFTKFKGEAPGDSLAPYWADQLFDGTIGSIPHFFETISFEQYEVKGEYLPKRYEMPYDSDYYVEKYVDKDGTTRKRGYSEYSLDAVELLDDDPTVDFSRFDNEGSDGIPGSDDDDGYVDYMVLMPLSRPYDFILQLATGVMYIGLKAPYRTQNKNSVGEYIRIDKASGCVASAPSKNQAIGSICAELCHAYGAVDLMDKVYVIPENDSAGAGFWDILGRGALGWGERAGPVGPGAFNRMMMNSVGYQNQNLIDLYGIHQNVRMRDVGHPDGKIYRVWIGEKEYFLIEYRSNIGGNYYDRQIPQSGILIWHIDEKESNSTEHTKLCDLECADGKYLDKGYPSGNFPDPLKGSDNLDFWAHDTYYTTKYNGNQGDATDVFDGVNYTVFGTETNPNSYSQVTKRPTGIEILNIRKEGDEMVFDCYLTPVPEVTPMEAPYIGMAFQRSRTGSSYQNLIDWEKEVYLINFGLSQKPDALVTINKDSLVVEPLVFSSSYEVQKAIERHLLTSDENIRSSQIIRRYVPIKEFNALTSQFDVLPEEFGCGRETTWVQKIVCLSGHEIQNIASIVLKQNYPNPFNCQTSISYMLLSGGPTRLEVFNILGQRVMLIDHGYDEAGQHTILLDASQLPSGMYLYRLRGRSLSQTRKFTIIK